MIELLTVMAMIVLLLSISFGLFKGVQKRADIVQAKGELGVLATALESYKLQYGDYPRTGGKTQAPAIISSVISTSHAQSKLFNALVGKLGPKLDALASRTGAKFFGKSFIETGRFYLETDNFLEEVEVEIEVEIEAGPEVANSFLDPWGNRYLYFYVDDGSAGAWTIPGYLLYSIGPDEEVEDKDEDYFPDNGTVDYNPDPPDKNTDNLYANRSDG